MITIDIKKEFMGDWISREAGERLRNRIIEILSKYKTVEIDFSNMMIASTSFFDEGIAKLSAEHQSQVHFKNLHARDKIVLDELCKNRM